MHLSMRKAIRKKKERRKKEERRKKKEERRKKEKNPLPFALTDANPNGIVIDIVREDSN